MAKLTREQILTLERQELIEAAAERVMGWKIGQTIRPEDGEIETFFVEPPSPDLSRIRDNWNPLTDENCLAEIWNALLQRMIWISISENPISSNKNQSVLVQWQTVGQGPGYPGSFWGAERRETLLRAALLAVNQEEEK